MTPAFFENAVCNAASQLELAEAGAIDPAKIAKWIAFVAKFLPVVLALFQQVEPAPAPAPVQAGPDDAAYEKALTAAILSLCDDAFSPIERATAVHLAYAMSDYAKLRAAAA